MKYYFWCAEVYDSDGDLFSKPSGTMSADADVPPDEAFEDLQNKLAEHFADCHAVVVTFNNVV